MNDNSTAYGSFRWALENAQDGDTIEFARNLSGKIYYRSNTEALKIDKKSITIIGHNVIIDGQSEANSQVSRCCLEISSLANNNIIIDGITFQNGNNWGFDGGAIQYSTNNKSSKLKITNCSFINNQATNGGALSFNGGYLTIEDSHFIGNSAGRHGGAICFASSLGNNVIQYNIDNCTFKNNNATNFGGALYAYYGYNSQLDYKVQNSKFIDNTASNGGGIWTREIYMDHVYMKGNKALQSGTGYGGGAVYLIDGNADLRYCTLTQNHAASYGGGFLFNSGNMLKIENSIIDGNTCDFKDMSDHGSGAEL